MLTPLPTLRQLRYLVALDEHRHFGRAAEACLATQSTLSAGLQELETLLGATLIERTRRKVMPTPLGEEVIARARRLLRDAEDVVDLVKASGQALSGTLRLGVIPTIAPYLLPAVLPGLREAYPDLRLRLREDQTARLIERLSAGTLDVALLALPVDLDDFEVMPLGEDGFVFTARPSHKLAAKTAITTEDLAGADLLLLEEGHCLREHALAACRLVKGGDRDLLATSLPTLVQMVAYGLGVTLVPRMAVSAGILAGTGLITRELAEPAGRGIGLVWRPSSPRAAEFRLLGEMLYPTTPPA